MSRHVTTTNVNPRRTRIGRPRQWTLLVAAALALWTTKASAQLDPLLFLKRVAPNILFVVDLGPGMLSDADGNYYDPYQYKWSKFHRRDLHSCYSKRYSHNHYCRFLHSFIKSNR